MKSWSVALMVVMAACGSERAVIDDGQRDCAQLRDRLVEIQMQSVTTDRDEVRAAFRASLGDRFIAHCLGEMSDDERACALAANDAAALSACHAD